jgi:hypothetical protein
MRLLKSGEWNRLKKLHAEAIDEARLLVQDVLRQPE